MAANRKDKGRQQGSQHHAEGQHGDRAHRGFIESRHGRHGGSEESEGSPQDHSNEKPGPGLRSGKRPGQRL